MNWAAKWIWSDQGSQPRNQWWFFRKEFAAPEALWNGAQLRITADSQYEVYINDQRLGKQIKRKVPDTEPLPSVVSSTRLLLTV